MGLAQQSKEIGGRTYVVSQLPAMKALRMLNRLGRIFCGPLARVAGGVKGDRRKVGLTDLDVSALGPAIDQLFANMSESELEAITRELLAGATYTTDAGKTVPLLPAFDLAMQGRTMEVLSLLRFAVEVNYGDFFGALRGLFAAQAAETEEPARSDSPSE